MPSKSRLYIPASAIHTIRCRHTPSCCCAAGLGAILSCMACRNSWRGSAVPELSEPRRCLKSSVIRRRSALLSGGLRRAVRRRVAGDRIVRPPGGLRDGDLHAVRGALHRDCLGLHLVPGRLRILAGDPVHLVLLPDPRRRADLARPQTRPRILGLASRENKTPG